MPSSSDIRHRPAVGMFTDTCWSPLFPQETGLAHMKDHCVAYREGFADETLQFSRRMPGITTRDHFSLSPTKGGKASFLALSPPQRRGEDSGPFPTDRLRQSTTYNTTRTQAPKTQDMSSYISDTLVASSSPLQTCGMLYDPIKKRIFDCYDLFLGSLEEYPSKSIDAETKKKDSSPSWRGGDLNLRSNDDILNGHVVTDQNIDSSSLSTSNEMLTVSEDAKSINASDAEVYKVKEQCHEEDSTESNAVDKNVETESWEFVDIEM